MSETDLHQFGNAYPQTQHLKSPLGKGVEVKVGTVELVKN